MPRKQSPFEMMDCQVGLFTLTTIPLCPKQLSFFLLNLFTIVLTESSCQLIIQLLFGHSAATPTLCMSSRYSQESESNFNNWQIACQDIFVSNPYLLFNIYEDWQQTMVKLLKRPNERLGMRRNQKVRLQLYTIPNWDHTVCQSTTRHISPSDYKAYERKN